MRNLRSVIRKRGGVGWGARNLDGGMGEDADEKKVRGSVMPRKARGKRIAGRMAKDGNRPSFVKEPVFPTSGQTSF